MLREINEFQQICSAEEAELTELRNELSGIVGDNFVQSLSESGCARWESMLKITPKATDSVQDRRFRILAALNQDTPYTMRGLRQQLEILCGADGYSAELDANRYSLAIRLALTAKGQFDEVQNLLARILPANICAEITLKYNQHTTLGVYTHGQLAVRKHNDLRNEVLT